MIDLNLINQIIYVDISIQSLKWVLSFEMAMIQRSGFIQKPWSFVLSSSGKEIKIKKNQEGDFNQDLIPILNWN